jgi:hypothetical protein
MGSWRIIVLDWLVLLLLSQSLGNEFPLLREELLTLFQGLFIGCV